MHRLLPLVTFAALAVVGACGHGKAHGPAWPEPSKTAEDGGESIEPRPSATYASVVESSNDANADKPAAAASDDKPAAAATDDKPAAAPATNQLSVEDVFMSEEIIIEIEE